jgi:hypothetical protein
MFVVNVLYIKKERKKERKRANVMDWYHTVTWCMGQILQDHV